MNLAPWRNEVVKIPSPFDRRKRSWTIFLLSIGGAYVELMTIWKCPSAYKYICG
jgi:hypothetical protein